MRIIKGGINMIRDMITHYGLRALILGLCIVIKATHLPLEYRLDIRGEWFETYDKKFGGFTSEDINNFSSLQLGTFNMMNRYMTELGSTDFSIRRVIFGK